MITETQATTTGEHTALENVVTVIVPKGEEHLVVKISQETYDEVSNIVLMAEDRQLSSSFEYWLAALATKHAKVQEKLWNNADDAATLKRAKGGNLQAKIAMLVSLGLTTEKATEIATAKK